ncbi:MAG: IPT/TIG domain-containing protein [Bryobacteraceae bacterium]
MNKLELDHRLEAYFATLRPSTLRDVLKRSAENWPIYAAVTGSALAMTTSTSAAIIGSGLRDTTVDPTASVLNGKPQFASTQNLPLAVRMAIAKQRSIERPASGAGAEANRATATLAPTISPNGVVPIYGTTDTIQPGEWVTVYGTNLAGSAVVWNGDFPISLGGTSVTINGRSAYLMFVSPDQINLQAPDDTARGTVQVVVTTGAGSATATVTLSEVAPSFCLFEMPNSQTGYVAGIILRSNGSGAYGGGKYDILGPTGNSLGYATVAAQPGDVVELFGVGFGPTTPTVAAGQAYSGAAPIDNTLTLFINNVSVPASFVGLSSAGLYQINLTVPSGLGQGEVPIQANVEGMETQVNVVFSLSNTQTTNTGGTVVTTNGGIPVTGGGFGGTGIVPTGGTNGGTNGGGTNGGTGGDDSKHKKKPHKPRLHYVTDTGR